MSQMGLDERKPVFGGFANNIGADQCICDFLIGKYHIKIVFF